MNYDLNTGEKIPYTYRLSMHSERIPINGWPDQPLEYTKGRISYIWTRSDGVNFTIYNDWLWKMITEACADHPLANWLFDQLIYLHFNHRSYLSNQLRTVLSSADFNF